MRLRSGSEDSRVSGLVSPVSPSKDGVRGRIQRFFKGNRRNTAPAVVPDLDPVATATGSRSDGQTDGPPATPKVIEEIFTFEDYMKLQHFSKASQLLINQEDKLFMDSSESDRLQDWNSDADKLRSQHEQLTDAVLETVLLSLNRGEVKPQVLVSAVNAVCKENDRDNFWKEQELAQSPKWRPCRLRKRHDDCLKTLIAKRMDSPDAPCSSPEAAQESSIQSHILSMGRQVKQDLETVVEVVVMCYPKDMDICNFYAMWFHHVFEARLRKIADFGLDDKDCTFILRWVNEYYPKILEKLSEHIDAASLGKLLSPSVMQPLEEQYFTKQQSDMQTYISKVLDEAKEMWTKGELPKTEDGCFVSDTAFHIIQFVNGAVKSAATVLDDGTEAQGVTSVLPELLQRYKSFLDEVMRRNRPNSVPTLKANLHCIQQFSEVLGSSRDLFQDEVRRDCLVLLKEMQQSTHTLLLSPVHAELKPLFKRLSGDWLKGAQFKKILETIESKSEDLQGVVRACHQELLGRLQLDVSVEYVNRLIRGEKLKDSKKQLEAHNLVQRDAEQLHQCFSKLGSQGDWLKEVLVRIAELLKLQDLAAIQMHVAHMGSCYPDFSEKHVSAILKLKYNFTKANRQIVKDTLRDTLSETSSTSSATATSFFSLVPV